MKNVILGTIAGLLLGTVGALAYSHYLGDGALLADLQAKLDAANASLAKVSDDKKQLAQETTGVSDQVDALQASNAELKKQLADLKSGAPAPAPADTQQPNLAAVARMMFGAIRGMNNPQQRMLLLKTRLKLTPDQEAQIKAAMDADNQKRRELGRQMFTSGKIDPQAAAAANTLDQTLNAILTPDQQASYKQVQADEQAARANTAATVQVNQIAPLLQLSDAQRDQVFQSVYQLQSSAPDPGNLMTNPNAAAVLTSQAQAMQAAMAKVLTPDQLSLYQQQLQAAPQPGRRGNGGNGGSGGGNGGNGGTPGQTVSNVVTPGSTPPVQATATTQVVNPQGAPPATTATAATADPNAPATNAPATDASTNAAPAATTNAAPTQ